MAPPQIHRVGASGSVRDLVWLNQQLSRALGWDDDMIEGVVETIACAANRAAVNDVVESYMGNDAAAVRIVNEYFSSKGSSAGLNSTHGNPSSIHNSSQDQHKNSSSSSSASRPGQTGYSSAVGGVFSASNGTSAKAAVPADGWRAISRNDDAEMDYKSSTSKSKNARVAGTKATGEHQDTEDVILHPELPEQRMATQPTTTAISGGAKVPEKVLGMFKQGGKIKTSTASSKPKETGPVLPDKPIVNCLGCGKIYDCRTATNSSDVRQFLESGGICTYCTKQVSLTYKDRIAAQQQQEQAKQQEQQDHSIDPPPPLDDAATVAAIAFKDRLVEYDRNAAKRTAVIDDQSDYFEIDSNAWLNDAEREVLRRQRVIEQEAEEIRKKRVTITLDLIGRKVIMDTGAHGGVGEEVAGGGVGGTSGGFGVLGEGAAVSAASTSGASSNTLTAPPAATAADLARAVNQLREMKITINPNLTAASKPVFLSSVHNVTHPKPNSSVPQQQPNTNSSNSIPGQTYNNLNPSQHQQKTQNGNGSSNSAASNGSSNSRTGPASNAAGTSSSRTGPGDAGGRKVANGSRTVGRGNAGRLQHDHGSEFNALIEDDLGVGAGAAVGGWWATPQVMPEGGGLLIEQIEAARPFDLCPPEMAGDKGSAFASIVTLQRGKSAAPARPPPSQASTPAPTPTLPPGMVLLKSWLSITEQAKLVKDIKRLGVGEGGFYTPSYPDGAQLALRMMCMGKHWEPTTASYADSRIYHDGATPPDIPSSLLQLVTSCLLDAGSMSVSDGGFKFPSFTPDVCLANFYEKQGRLGMHQDKDESPVSLKAGLPVVSFSIGDSADFLFGSTRDPDTATKVQLESGDVLIFGGPSRMVYHGVSKIHTGSAPQALLTKCGLRPGRLNLTFRQM